MRFAFIVHPLTRRDYLRSCSGDAALPRMLRNVVFRYLAVYLLPSRTYPYFKSLFSPQRVFTYRRLVSTTGAVASGDVISAPNNAEELVADQGRAVQMLRRECQRLAETGVDLVGLGGVNGVIGSYGHAVAEGSPVPVTTGASYTAFAAIETLTYLAERLGQRLAGLSVSLVGLPGRNARVLAELLVRYGVDLCVVADLHAPYVQRLLAPLRPLAPIRVIDPCRLYEALGPGEILMAASSTGNKIDARLLPRGAMVIDVSLPRDVIHTRPRRRDILVIDGEVVRVPPGSTPERDFFSCGDGHVLACLAESCILAMEGRRESFTVGRHIEVTRVEKIGALARRHGFGVDGLYAFGRPVRDARIEVVRRLQDGRAPVFSLPAPRRPSASVR